MGVVAFSALSSISTLRKEIHSLSDDGIGGVTALTEFIEASKQARIVQFQIASAEDSKAHKLEQQVQDSEDTADKALATYEKQVQPGEDSKNFNALKTGWEEYKNVWKANQKEILEAKGSKGFDLLEATLTPIYLDKVQPDTDTILKWNKEDSAKMVDHADDASASATKSVSVASILAFVLGIAFAIFMTKTIVSAIIKVSTGMSSLSSRCVPELTAGLGALANGDLTIPAKVDTAPVSLDTKDELGAMSKTFNSMLEMVSSAVGSYNSARASLSELVGTVSDNAASVASTSQTLASATEESGAASSEIASGSQKLADSASEAAAVMEELSAHVENVATGSESQSKLAEDGSISMRKASAGIEEVATAAKQMDTLATEGDVAVKETVSAIERLRVKVEYSAQKVKELDEHGQMIGQIVLSIEQIAEQTNLLALNAAIEAARAGEHGRGFAVVAEEVRKLAEQAASSTKQISVMIGSVTSTVNETVSAIQETNDEVEAGTRQSEQAGKSLAQILAAARKVATSTETVAQLTQKAASSMESMATAATENLSISQEMASGTQRVVKAITDVAAISQESAAGAEELSASIEEVGAAATEMSQMSMELQALISRFNVDREASRGAGHSLRMAA